MPASDAIKFVPGLARIAAKAWWHATEWTVGTSVRTGMRVLDAVVPPANADIANKVADAVPFAPPQNGGSSNGVPRSLREEGELLLERSRDVHYDEPAHPAYERILSLPIFPGLSDADVDRVVAAVQEVIEA